MNRIFTAIVRAGTRIAQISPGKMMGRAKANQVIAAVNAFLNLRAVVTDSQDARLIIGDGISVLQIPRGTSTGSGDGGTTTGGMRYRGLWLEDPPSPYLTQDVVLIQAGPTAGTYISVTDNNTESPDTGIGWVQLAPGNTVGAWA